MTDFAGDTLSTVIDADPRPSEAGGGMPTAQDGQEAADPKAAPRPPRDDLEHVFREETKKQESKEPAKPDDKAPEQPKAASEKPAQEEKTAEPVQEKAQAPVDAEKAPEGRDEAKPEGRKIEPPARLLPDAKEHWRNTPRSVQRDIEAAFKEHETEISRHRETAQRYESIRDFDELARSNGRELRESLMKVHQVENLMRTNPLAGLNSILMELGPRKADGQPLSLYDVAQHIAQQGPQAYQQMMAQQAPPQQQERQPDPEVQQLKQQLNEMQQQQVLASVIEPFRQANPRYDELEQDIAFFLQSGRIPQSLSLHDRLSAAYDMAARINPASHVEAETGTRDPDTERRADDSFSGKSIKSAPGSVSEEVEDSAPTKESIRDSILKAGRGLRR